MRKRLLLLLVLIIAVLTAAIMYQHAAAPEPRPSTNPSPNQPSFNKKQFSTTDPASIWVVVNKQHPLNPIAYAPTDLTLVGNGQYMRAEAANALQAMFSAAQTAGYKLTAASGYRSYATQVNTYNSEVKAYGQAQADSESARAGYSEHQTGWAVDIGGGGCNIADCFANTPEGKWAQANAYQYGFVLRYTAADSSITGYRAEAWHFRYVGTALASEMHRQGVATLEQFFNIPGGSDYKS